MPTLGDSRGDLPELVEHMFYDVFTEAERSELLERIRAWEAANPAAAPADRVMAWIDIAYEYQVGREPARGFADHSPVRRPRWSGFVSAQFRVN